MASKTDAKGSTPTASDAAQAAQEPTVESLQAELTAVQDRFTNCINTALKWATEQGVCDRFDTVMALCNLPVRSNQKRIESAQFQVFVTVPIEYPEGADRYKRRDVLDSLVTDKAKVREAALAQLGEDEGVTIRHYQNVNTPLPFTYADLVANGHS